MRSWSNHRPLSFLLILHFLGLVHGTFNFWFLQLSKEGYKNAAREFKGKFEDIFDNGAKRLWTSEAYRDNFSKLLVQTMSKNGQFKRENLDEWMKKLKQFLKILEVVDDVQIMADPFKTWFAGLKTALTKGKDKTDDGDLIKNGDEPVIYFSTGTFTEEMMKTLIGQEFWSKGRNFYLASIHSVFDTIEMCISAEETSCIEVRAGKREESKNYAMVQLNKVRMKVLLAMIFKMLDSNLDSNMANKPAGKVENKAELKTKQEEEDKDTEGNKAADSQNHSPTKGSWLKIPKHIKKNRFKYGLGMGFLAGLGAAYKWNTFQKYSDNSSSQHENGQKPKGNMPQVGTVAYPWGGDDSGSSWIIYLLLLLLAVAVGLTAWWIEPCKTKPITEKKETHGKQKESKKGEKTAKKKSSKKKASSETAVPSTLPSSSSEASSSIVLREGAQASGDRKSVVNTPPSVDSPGSKINSKVMSRNRYCDQTAVLRSPASKMSPVVSSKGKSSAVASPVVASSRTPVSKKSKASSVVTPSTPQSSQ